MGLGFIVPAAALSGKNIPPHWGADDYLSCTNTSPLHDLSHLFILTTIKQSTIMARNRKKSKADLTAQIQRIYANFKDHRLYNIAQQIVMVYNWRMSETEVNKAIHRKYMDCHYSWSGNVKVGMEKLAEMYLRMLGGFRYPIEVYTRPTQREITCQTRHN